MLRPPVLLHRDQSQHAEDGGEEQQTERDRPEPPAHRTLAPRLGGALALGLEVPSPLENRLAEHVVEELVARALVRLSRRRRHGAQDAAALAGGQLLEHCPDFRLRPAEPLREVRERLDDAPPSSA